jgi:uncharacterized protein (TIGR03545 family)
MMRKSKLWRRLAIGVGIIALIIVIGILMIDPIVKNQIEKRGTLAVGAKVELAQVDVSFFPLGVTLTDLQMTDPNAPMSNALRVDRINAFVEIGPLIQRKIIIEEMVMDRARFNTPRSTSGAVPGLGSDTSSAGGPVGQECQSLKLPAWGSLDIDTILDQARLASLNRLDALQKRIEAQQAEWRQKLEALPGPETLEVYRQRIEKFTSGTNTSVTALLGAPVEIQALQKDIQQDLDLLKNAQKNLSQAVIGFNGQLDAIKGLADQDVDALVQKYSIKREDLKSVSKALFGETFCIWVAKGLNWYDRIQPLLNQPSDSGGTVPPKPAPEAAGKPETETLPDFLIRKAVVSVELNSGTITGGLRNVTSQQEILGQPMAFYLSGEKLKGVDLVQISGVLDHVQPVNTRDTLDMLMQGLALENFEIPSGLPMKISRAMADIQLNSSLSGRTLDAVLKTGLSDAVIEFAQTDQMDLISDVIASVIGELREIDIAALVNGTMQDYTMKIESGLDRVLEPAMAKVVQKHTAALKAQLSGELAKRITPVMGTTRQTMAGYGPIEDELLTRLNLGQDLIRNLKLPF